MEVASKFEIHYYLNDNSHSMDAFVRNKCELEFLETAKEVSRIFGIHLVLESQAIEEGGIREIWKAVGDNGAQIAILLTIIQILYSFVPATDSDLIDLQKEDLRLSIQERQLRIKNAKESPNDKTLNEAAEVVNSSYKVIRKKSNFYETLKKCDKVYQAGFSTLDENNCRIDTEKIIERKSFSKFVIKESKLPVETNESATIDIISPVIKEGKSKWKVIYNEKHIYFAMDDEIFKRYVLGKRVSFKNGSRIVCVLKIHRKLDEAGEVKITGYSVDTVLEVSDGENLKETLGGKTHKQAKEMRDNQGSLF